MTNNNPVRCPHCKNDDESLIDYVTETKLYIVYNCIVCSKRFSAKKYEDNRKNEE